MSGPKCVKVASRLLSMFFIILISSSSCSGNRVKRVIDGKRVVGRYGPYNSVRYLVAIGDVHETHWYTFGFFLSFLRYFGTYGTVACGGSLLTPAIVQTACHCLSYLNTGARRGTAVVNHHWENERVVYIGLNDRFEGLDGAKAFMDVYPVASKKFIIHKKCEKLPPGTVRTVSHDFGYISIDPDWVKGKKDGVPIKGVDFAPIYTTRELLRTYYRFVRDPPVCMVIGWGDSNKRPPFINIYITDYTLYGWVHLTSDYECRDFTKTGFRTSEFHKVRTWVCTDEFPKHDQPPFHGDSGGPLTCNNAYFGLVSGGVREFSTNRRFVIYSATIYTPFANAYEYRPAFEQDIKQKTSYSYLDLVYRLVDELGTEFLGDKVEEALPEVLPDFLPIARRINSTGNWSSKHRTVSPIPKFKLKPSSVARLLRQGVSSSSNSHPVQLLQSVLLLGHIPAILFH